MKNLILFVFVLVLAVMSGCSKMEEKKTTANEQQMGQMPPDHGNMQQANDEAMKMSQEAMDFEKVYEKDKSAKNKSELIKKHLAAGLALSPKQDMGHMNKESIRLALKHLRRVIALDPANKDANDEMKSIEEMYNQIGMPVPEDK